MPEAKHDSAEKILHLRRVLQTSAKCVLHPSPRLLRCAHDRVATAVSNQRAIFRITNKEHSTKDAAHEVRTHIEFSGNSPRRYRPDGSKKLKFVTEFRHSFPMGLPNAVPGLFS